MVLTAMGILAVVGSVLAFKAHKSYVGTLRCSFTTSPTVTCTLQTYAEATVGVRARCTRITEPAGTPCVLLTVIELQ